MRIQLEFGLGIDEGYNLLAEPLTSRPNERIKGMMVNLDDEAVTPCIPATVWDSNPLNPSSGNEERHCSLVYTLIE